MSVCADIIFICVPNPHSHVVCLGYSSNNSATTWQKIGVSITNPNARDGFVLNRARFKKRNDPGFLNSHLPVEVQAMLSLLVKLYLENNSVTQENSYLRDSCMLEIKASSHIEMAGSAIHFNSFNRTNAVFTKFVIDYLCIALLFDNWYPFAGNSEYFSGMSLTYASFIHTIISHCTLHYYK